MLTAWISLTLLPTVPGRLSRLCSLSALSCNIVFIQNMIKKWTNGCTLPLPKKGDFRITKKYWDINLTVIASKVYRALLPNHIWDEIDKISRRNWSATFLIMTVCHQRHTCKKSQSNTIVCRFLQDIWFHTLGKDGANTTSIWSLVAIMMLNKKTQIHGFLTTWKHWLLWHCCLSLARRYGYFSSLKFCCNPIWE